jgi:hypothetical protein
MQKTDLKTGSKTALGFAQIGNHVVIVVTSLKTVNRRVFAFANLRATPASSYAARATGSKGSRRNSGAQQGIYKGELVMASANSD